MCEELLLYACNCCKTWPAFEEIERERQRGVRILDSGKGCWSATQQKLNKKIAENLQKTRVGLLLYSIERWKEIGRKIWYIEYTQKSYYIRYKQIITKIKSKHKVKSKTQSNTYETQLKSHLIAALSARHSQEYILYIYNTLYVCIYV